MTIKELIKEINCRVVDETLLDQEVTDITEDTRKIRAGMIFMCIKGLKVDGHDLALKALEGGAVAVVTSRDLGLARQIVIEDDARVTYAKLCAAVNGNPQRKIKLVGVTGTNGKTTTSTVIKHILDNAGYKTGLIGTIEHKIGGITIPSSFTTPEASEFYRMLGRMVKEDCNYCVMEVSSHALDQQRVAGSVFEAGVFTNLTLDHLDYHKTMDNYFEAKKRLFDICKTGVVNLDDSYGPRMAEEGNADMITFSIDKDTADYTAKNIEKTPSGVRFELVGREHIGRVKFKMPGMFSVSNAMGAAIACISIGIPFDKVIEGLNTCGGVEGRTQVVTKDQPFTILSDYAHTPDGLDQVLSTLKEFVKGRLVVVFGCAGERDRTKRPKMAEVVSKYADFIIISSDNPRSEDPWEIIKDVEPGIKKDIPYVKIPDRYEAIEWGVKNAQPDDVIIYTGMGHEKYIALDGYSSYYNEAAMIKEALEKFRSE